MTPVLRRRRRRGKSLQFSVLRELRGSMWNDLNMFIRSLRFNVWNDQSLLPGHIVPFNFLTVTDKTEAWIFSSYIQPGAWAHVCTRGARVILKMVQEKQNKKSNSAVRRRSWTLKSKVPVQCGTVVGLTKEGIYQVRLDKANAIVNVDLRPDNDNVLPETRHQYKAGQRLRALCPVDNKFAKPVWTDCHVVKYLGLEQGSRHKLCFPNFKRVEMDLNRFNHYVPDLLGFSSEHVDTTETAFSDTGILCWIMSDGFVLQQEVEKQVREA